MHLSDKNKYAVEQINKSLRKERKGCRSFHCRALDPNRARLVPAGFLTMRGRGVRATHRTAGSQARVCGK